MDGQHHIPDSDLVSLRTKNEVNKEKLPDLKRFSAILRVKFLCET